LFKNIKPHKSNCWSNLKAWKQTHITQKNQGPLTKEKGCVQLTSIKFGNLFVFLTKNKQSLSLFSYHGDDGRIRTLVVRIKSKEFNHCATGCKPLEKLPYFKVAFTPATMQYTMSQFEIGQNSTWNHFIWSWFEVTFKEVYYLDPSFPLDSVPWKCNSFSWSF
jgi:hypothetical protein